MLPSFLNQFLQSLQENHNKPQQFQFCPAKSIHCLVLLVFVLTNFLVVLVFVTSILLLWSMASFSLRGGSTSPWPLCGGRPRQLILVWSPVPGHYNCDWDRDRETIAKDPESDSSSSILSSFYQQHKQSFILVWRQTMRKDKSLSLAEMEHIHFCLMRKKKLVLEQCHSKTALMV